MSLSTFRRLGTVNGLPDIQRVLQDAQQNFDTIRLQCPQINDDLPSAGTVKFLAQEADGSWHTWELLAGAGVSFVQDNSARTLTVKAP